MTTGRQIRPTTVAEAVFFEQVRLLPSALSTTNHDEGASVSEWKTLMIERADDDLDQILIETSAAIQELKVEVETDRRRLEASKRKLLDCEIRKDFAEHEIGRRARVLEQTGEVVLPRSRDLETIRWRNS